MLFGLVKKRTLGVDIGATNLKIVELEHKGKSHELLTFGSVPLHQSIIRAAGEQQEQEVADVLSKLCKQIGVSTSHVIAGLPGFATFTALIELPLMPEKELSFAIEAEAHKYVPAPMDEVMLDSRYVDQITLADGTKKQRVLLIAAPKDYVNKFVRIFQKSNLTLDALEVTAFGLIRALVPKVSEVVCILDIGAVTTDINIVQNGSLLVNHSVQKGSGHLTDVVRKSMNVDASRAEQFKRDMDLMDLTKNFEQPIPRAIKPLVDVLISEIQHVMSDYERQSAGKVARILVTGGGSLMKGMDKYIEHVTQIPTIVPDPWQFVHYPEIHKKILQENASFYAVSIGLALHE